MQILIDSSTTPTQLRLIATLCTSLAGDAAASIELTPAEPAVPAQMSFELRSVASELPGFDRGGAEQLDLLNALTELSELQGFNGAGLPRHVTPFVPAPPVPVTTSASSVQAPALPAPCAAPPLPPAALDPTHDKTGRGWDARIDSSSKAMNADGTWRARRGVDAATYQAVLRELGVTVPPPAVVAPPATHGPAEYIPTPAEVFAGAQVVGMVNVPVPPVTPPTPTNAPPVTFSYLMQLAMPLTREGKLTSDWLNTCSAEIGAPSPQHMIGNQELLTAAQKWIQARA